VLEALVIAADAYGTQAAAIQLLPEMRRFPVHEFRAKFNGRRTERVSMREDAPADATTRFQHNYARAGSFGLNGSSQTRRPRADDGDVEKTVHPVPPG
jgi:hypothetical protein